MRNIYLLLMGLILFIPNMVLANSISNIDMNIYVDDSGTAHVTEEWTANLYEGTDATTFLIFKPNKSSDFFNAFLIE